MKLILRALLRMAFGFRAFNEGVLRTPGPVLLVPNHPSLLDWLFLGVCLEDDWKFVVSSVTARTNWLYRKIMLNRRTFPIDTLSPYAARHMAEYLQAGGRLVLFAEGRVTRSGAFMKLFEGTGFLLHKTRAKIITAYVRHAVDLPWVTVHRNRRNWRARVSVHFSGLLEPAAVDSLSSSAARQVLTRWLRDQMVEQQFKVEMAHGPGTVMEAVTRTARARARQVAFEDMSRAPVTYRRLLLGAEVLAGQWRRRLRDSPGKRVGVLLPNVGATPVVVLSLWAAGHVPAVLNYSTGTPTMLACVELAGLRQIITSRAFIERAQLEMEPLAAAGLELLYLEDVRAGVGILDRLAAWAIERLGAGPCNDRLRPEDAAVILFTSGSEGMPKGVELTHANLMANIRQMLAVIDLQDNDRLFNALPMFHSFGLTVGTLLPLVRGIYVCFYLSPLHYRVVPTVVYDRDCTILLGTNTFLNGYARRAHPYDFHRVRYLFAGAEKVQEATADIWARRFGVRILEGYGVTECSPVVSVNTHMGARHGSAGRLMPGIQWRVEPVDGVAEGGRLFIRGPNVMRGYLNPEADAAFQALGGWYDTGDIARVDADGFVHILGRLKRFAKISGEMVSLTAVEDALAGAFTKYGARCEVAVISRPDADKGELLIAFTNEPRLQVEALRTVIRSRGLSNLCVPREIRVVPEIPKLGTGKVNHRALLESCLAGPEPHVPLDDPLRATAR
jgi:acyl-[acyl-carrier-protein]-phospholipid O-acyltransferase / long-chain-fatty-acid--[acyl-carrier-protein] ligase